MGAIARVEFAADRTHAHFHRNLAYRHIARDFLVGQPLGRAAEDEMFLFRQRRVRAGLGAAMARDLRARAGEGFFDWIAA